MAKSSISGGNPVEAVHTRTTAGSEDSQVVVVGIDGSDSVIPATAGQGLKVDTSASLLFTARVTLTGAAVGNPAQFASNVTKSVFVCALQTNTQQVAIGDANTNALSANLQGIPLQPGQGISLDVANTNTIYLDVLGDGHGVTWTAIS